jgi:hypothetical protein
VSQSPTALSYLPWSVIGQRDQRIVIEEATIEAEEVVMEEEVGVTVVEEEEAALMEGAEEEAAAVIVVVAQAHGVVEEIVPPPVPVAVADPGLLKFWNFPVIDGPRSLTVCT